MKYRSIISCVLFLCLAFVAKSQNQEIHVDAASNGQTFEYVPSVPTGVMDDDANPNATGCYTHGIDYHITIHSDSCTSPTRFSLVLTMLDINEKDTLFIYDGTSTASPRLFAINNVLDTHLLNRAIYISPTNTSNALTVRFKTSSAVSSNHTGFMMRAACGSPCEMSQPVIDSFYYRTIAGQIIDTSVMTMFYSYDTIKVRRGDIWVDSLVVSDSIRGVPLCLGQGVRFVSHGVYTHDYGYYNPTDENSIFYWTFGNGDSLSGPGLYEVTYEGYLSLDCYEVQLHMEDVNGCPSALLDKVQVRLSPNPIKTIYSLPAICNNDSLLVNVGYDGDNARLTLKKITFSRHESKTNDVRTFIPDGECPPDHPDGCFYAPVEFTEFPNKSITSKQDVCSICVNFEHSFMGDYRLAIVCPTGKIAVLKWAQNGHEPNLPPDAPTGSYGGSGTYTGYPLDWSECPFNPDGSPKCDSVQNPYGMGLDYCFSRNAEYTLVDGTAADVPAFNAQVNTYLGSPGFTDQVSPSFPNVPSQFALSGQTIGTLNMTTKHPSNHEGMSDYYTPYTDFSELVGCPLNGEWNIQVCDFWGADNGWVFNWSMDICGAAPGGGCDYQVGIDSVTWGPAPGHSDTINGHYRGLVVTSVDSVSGWVSSPDTAGVFPINLTVHDEFGCNWDTNTVISTVWVPEPNLGNDTILCDVQTTVLDAKDRHTATNNYSYIWEPTGETTDTIITPSNQKKDVIYTVEVSNTHNTGLVCFNRDSITVFNHAQPVPNFDAGVYPLEGCEPFTLNITNTSLNGDRYFWDFGDGTTSTEKNPTHTYAAGRYDFKYYIYSDGGCADSLLYTDLVAVFPSPTAKFSWEPVYPTVLNPSVQLVNLTVPQDDNNKYFWEVQYDKDNPLSVHTVTDVNPIFDWESTGEDISGTYTVRLIARTDNMPPSGKVVKCADTADATILLINDFLQFPNVVTPNGDGINDKFVIKNLVSGLAYPINCLDIYDRWGGRVFHKENIATEDDFWDPVNAPAGTYYYKFSARGYNGNIDHNGVIEVLR